MVRTFVSIDFTDTSIINKIIEIQDSIKKSGAKLKLVNPELLHITLEFLGYLTLDEVKSVERILDSLTFNRFQLDVNEINVLPN